MRIQTNPPSRPESVLSQSSASTSASSASSGSSRILRRSSSQSSFSDQEIQGALVRDIESLTTAIYDVGSLFASVSMTLEDVKTKLVDRRASNNFRQDVYKLVGRWNRCHETFLDLRGKSCEVAEVAQGIADDFARTLIGVLSDHRVPIEEKKREISVWVEKLRQDDSASTITKRFTSLGLDVRVFHNEWVRIQEKYARDSIAKRIQGLAEAISDISAQIEAASIKIKLATLVFGIIATFTIRSVLQTVVACDLRTWLWSFLGTVSAALAGFWGKDEWSKYEILIEYLRSDKASLIKEKTFFSTDSIVAQEFGETVGTFGTESKMMCIHLSAFAKVWATFHTDIQQIKQKLVHTADSESDTCFEQRLEEVGILYDALRVALRQYQIVVSSAV